MTSDHLRAGMLAGGLDECIAVLGRPRARRCRGRAGARRLCRPVRGPAWRVDGRWSRYEYPGQHWWISAPVFKTVPAKIASRRSPGPAPLLNARPGTQPGARAHAAGARPGAALQASARRWPASRHTLVAGGRAHRRRPVVVLGVALAARGVSAFVREHVDLTILVRLAVAVTRRPFRLLHSPVPGR